MKEYIEKIIEIILEDVSCDHPANGDHSMGVNFNDATYCLNNEKAVIEKCIETIPARLIERPEITEDWIEQKAREFHIRLWGKSYTCDFKCSMMIIFREFISSLLNELAAKISLIGKEIS